MKNQNKNIPQNMPASTMEAVRGSGFNQGHRTREPDVDYFISDQFFNGKK